MGVLYICVHVYGKNIGFQLSNNKSIYFVFMNIYL